MQCWTAVARQEEGAPVEPENPYNQYSVRDWHLRYQLARTTQEVEVLLKKRRSAGASTPDVSGLMTTLSTAEQVHGAFEKWQAVIQPATASTPAAATQQALQK